MRRLVDVLLLLSIVALAMGGHWYYQYRAGESASFELLRDNVHRIQQQVALHATMEKVPRNNQGFPLEIDTAWFGNDIPLNPLLPPGHAWVEVADEADYRLDHPRSIVAGDDDAAGFWYNPNTGVVRARVPYLVSDLGTLDAYNKINGVTLGSLFESVAASTE